MLDDERGGERHLVVGDQIRVAGDAERAQEDLVRAVLDRRAVGEGAVDGQGRVAVVVGGLMIR